MNRRELLAALAPKSGPFNMTMRRYLPRPELLDGRWRLPAIEKA